MRLKAPFPTAKQQNHDRKQEFRPAYNPSKIKYPGDHFDIYACIEEDPEWNDQHDAGSERDWWDIPESTGFHIGNSQVFNGEDGTVPSEIIRPLPPLMGFKSPKSIHQNGLRRLCENPPCWQHLSHNAGGLTRFNFKR